MAIRTSFSLGHGMALFLVLFNRSRVPPRPRISICFKWASVNLYIRLVVQKSFSLPFASSSFRQTHSSGSSVVLFQVQSFFNKDLFLSFLSPPF